MMTPGMAILRDCQLFHIDASGASGADEPRKQIALTVQPQTVQHDERPRCTPGSHERDAGERGLRITPVFAVYQKEDTDSFDLLVEFGKAAVGGERPQRSSAWGVAGIDGALEVTKSAIRRREEKQTLDPPKGEQEQYGDGECRRHCFAEAWRNRSAGGSLSMHQLCNTRVQS